MPMSFPDYDSLKRTAEPTKFRKPMDGESEGSFREAFAVYIETKHDDCVMAHEIRTGKGWDKWDENEQKLLLLTQMLKDRA